MFQIPENLQKTQLDTLIVFSKWYKIPETVCKDWLSGKTYNFGRHLRKEFIQSHWDRYFKKKFQLGEDVEIEYKRKRERLTNDDDANVVCVANKRLTDLKRVGIRETIIKKPIEESILKTNSDKVSHYKKVIEKISLEDGKIVLLRNENVLKWIFGDTSFIKGKKEEDEWGRELLKLPHLWSGPLGEEIFKEFCLLQKHSVKKPDKIGKLQPDWETEDCIFEIKTQTYFTSGTAGEKILGAPFKYIKVPKLYNKPLKIVAIANAEKHCRQEYGIIEATDEDKQEAIEFYKKKNIEVVAFSKMFETFLTI
jgi:hypothetical protein